MKKVKELLKSKDGFSLVELMVAMTILIIILGVTSTMFISSSDLSRRITSSSEAQIACANMMEKIRLMVVNSREALIIDGASSGETVMDWRNAVTVEHNNDANVQIKSYKNSKVKENTNLQKNYGYVVCGNPNDGTDGGITIYMPDASGNLGEEILYDQHNTSAIKLFTRFEMNGSALTVKIWAVDKRYEDWASFSNDAKNAMPAPITTVDSEGNAEVTNEKERKTAYDDALKNNSVFYQETSIIMENSSIKSKRTSGTESQSEGRVLKFYIEQ